MVWAGYRSQDTKKVPPFREELFYLGNFFIFHLVVVNNG